MAPQAVGGDVDLARVHAGIAEYYTDKIREFGCTPFGVDWTCQPTQQMRFVQLLKLCDFSAPFSLNDLGCGYGALAAFLRQRHGACAVDYLGIDVSGEMVRRARRKYRALAGVRFVTGATSPRIADYSLASGIFNVQLDVSAERWDGFIRTTLRQLAATSKRGFAINFIAPALDGHTAKRGLYATRPEPWMEYCTHNLAADVQLIEGYGLHEFSLLVRHVRGNLACNVVAGAGPPPAPC